jgi:SAM-dependent methyltransferase
MNQATRGSGLLENILARQRDRQALRLIPPGFERGRLLDLGCGRVPVFLMRAGFLLGIGVDACIETPPAPLPASVHLLEFDLERKERLPFPDSSFHAVTMLAVLEHLRPETATALTAEARRVLRPAGLFLLTTPAAATHRLLRFMARLRLVSAIEIAEHQADYTKTKLRSLLIGAGFTPAAVTTGRFELGLNLWARAEKTDE